MTGAELVSRFEHQHRAPHRHLDRCPGCNEGVLQVGIPYLAYTFETCSCAAFDYDHLVEVLWHVPCLQGVGSTDDELRQALLEISGMTRAKEARLLALDVLNGRHFDRDSLR